MSDNEFGWDVSGDSIALPPTPGRTLNICTTTSTSTLADNVKTAKRRLELDNDERKEVKRPKEEKPAIKVKPSEEKVGARQLKVQAWARILKHKQKLYIPHTSDPRGIESAEEEKKIDKENSSKAANVTPVKTGDHDNIIRLMSITPKLLSPLAENPRSKSVK